MIQMLEEARIKMLQNEIWLKCNIVSAVCVEDDQVNYRVFFFRKNT